MERCKSVEVEETERLIDHKSLSVGLYATIDNG